MSVSEFTFQSFLQAGFECSTHKRRNGHRLDLVSATRHDEFVARDYERLQNFGIRTVREAARWHVIEATAGTYDFRSLDILLDAATGTGTEVILDLLHFGWPDRVDPIHFSFKHSFEQFTSAIARHLKRFPNRCRLIAPINEVSFLSWAGGDAASINPYLTGRGSELKRNLIRAAAASSEVLLNELPGVRLVSPEPVIHIVGNPAIPNSGPAAEAYRLSQFEAWDMLSGALAPELGGKPEYLDILGLNFYDRNEWVHQGERLTPEDPRYRPLHSIIEEVWARYKRPLFVSETGAEDEARAKWFNNVCQEVSAARARGIPVGGVCLYPILNHLGWDDDRPCHNGLFADADDFGNRQIHRPLAEAVHAQQQRFASNSEAHGLHKYGRNLPLSSPLGVCFSKTSASDEPVRENG